MVELRIFFLYQISHSNEIISVMNEIGESAGPREIIRSNLNINGIKVVIDDVHLRKNKTGQE